MSPTDDVRFGPFRFDRRLCQLYRDDEPVAVTQQALQVLDALLAAPGRLIRKDELIEAAWPRRFVSDSALAKRLQELRTALGDDARDPRYVQTVFRRGFRFVGEVEATAGGGLPIVGRDELWSRLAAMTEAARTGQRSLAALVGPAGIGKTEALRGFLAKLGATDALVLSGHCRRGAEGDPYLPVDAAAADALSTVPPVVHQPLAALRQCLSPSRPAALQDVGGTDRNRVLVEAGAILEQLIQRGLLVFSIEDVHWADPSTLALLEHLLRKPRAGGLLVVVTMRDAPDRSDALRALLGSALARGMSQEIALQPLTEADIRLYLHQRLDERIAAELTGMLYRRCRGMPMFLNWLVNELVETERIVRKPDGWRLHADAAAIDRALPESLARLFDLQLAGLSEKEHRILEICTLARGSTAPATLARVADLEESDVRDLLGELAQRGHLRATSESRVLVSHDLLASAVEQRIPEQRKRALHATFALALTAEGGEDSDLAWHWEQSATPGRAVVHLQRAGRQAAARFADQEAIRHLSRGIALLDRYAPDDDATKLELVSALVPSWLAVHGYTNPETLGLLTRSVGLSRMGSWSDRFAALSGIHAYHVIGGDLEQAEGVEPELLEAARQAGWPRLEAQAHQIVAARKLWHGRFDSARAEFVAGLERYAEGGPEPEAHPIWMPTDVALRAGLARTLCELGRYGAARDLVEVNRHALEREPNPVGHCLNLLFAVFVHVYRGEFVDALDGSRMLVELTEAYGYTQFEAWGRVMLGYLLARVDGSESGRDLLRESVNQLRSAGAELAVEACLMYLGETFAGSDRPAEGLPCTDSALELTRQRGGAWQGHIHLARYELRQACGDSVGAAAELQAALAAAQQVASPHIELRALTALLDCGADSGSESRLQLLVDASDDRSAPVVRAALAAIAGHQKS